MHTILQDLRHGWRGMGRHPWLTTAVVATMALGIGATTAIFSVVEATMLRPFPYPAPERLMDLRLTMKRTGDVVGEPFVWSYPKFVTFQTAQRSFASVAAYASTPVTVTGPQGAERIDAELVSGAYFPLLGAPIEKGRGLMAADDVEANPQPVAVLSHAIWGRRFAQDSAILGTSIRLNGHAFTVIGVAAPEFKPLSGSVDAWVPMAMANVIVYDGALRERWSHWLDAVGRLRDGVTSAQGRAELATLGAAIDRAHPSRNESSTWGAMARPLRDARDDPTLRRGLWVLLAAVGCVLLIACVNVANVLLARAAARSHELAVRQAIGAGRRRLFRQLLTEATLLALLGGAFGILLAVWGMDALRSVDPSALATGSTQPSQFLSLKEMQLNPAVLAFALGVTTLTGLACGVVPAFRASQPTVTDSLKERSAAVIGVGVWSRRGTARALLITGNVAISMMLSIAAGLLLRSFAAARGVDPGFSADHVVAFRFMTPDDEAYRGVNATALKERVLTRLAAIPGVQAVGVNFCAPLSDACYGSVVTKIEGRPVPARGTEPEIETHSVNEDFIRVIGARLVAGRFFTTADNRQALPVIVLNQAAARAFFPREDAVGKRMSVGIGLLDGGEKWAEVIGVMSDVNFRTVGRPAAPAMFSSYRQYARAGGLFFLRSAGAPMSLMPAAVRAVSEVDPNLPLYDVRTLEDRGSRALARYRFSAVLLASFAGLGLLLTAVGVYGTIAYTVSRRTREIGVRMALGAKSADVVRLVMQRAVLLGLGGVALGVAGAWAVSRVLQALLFGVSSTDPVTYAALAVGVAALAGLASWLPARRAAHIDPLIALRSE
ncbi:MAG: ABC transporter permease [Gemmatimonadaceae bacterium]